MAEKEVKTLKLISSHDEAGNVRTFVFETGSITWVAGQSREYVLPQAGESEDENSRRFTIASAPSEGTINISTRVSESKFKQALNTLKPGDTIQTHSPEGDFTWEEEPSEPVVLVAGGIGSTPFRSFLLERHNSGKKLNALFVYFNRTNDIPFLKEFEDLKAKHPEFEIKTAVGEPITPEAILKYAPEVKTRVLYLSGPEQMVEEVGGKLREQGINVKQDWFPGYDEKTY